MKSEHTMKNRLDGSYMCPQYGPVLMSMCGRGWVECARDGSIFPLVLSTTKRPMHHLNPILRGQVSLKWYIGSMLTLCLGVNSIFINSIFIQYFNEFNIYVTQQNRLKYWEVECVQECVGI